MAMQNVKKKLHFAAIASKNWEKSLVHLAHEISAFKNRYPPKNRYPL